MASLVRAGFRRMSSAATGSLTLPARLVVDAALSGDRRGKRAVTKIVLEESRVALPYARVHGGNLGDVIRVATRAERRSRESLADISLDKEATLATGVLTPGVIGSTAEEVGGGASAAAAARAAERVNVGQEAIDRIQRSFTHASPAARAGVAASLAVKAAQQEARDTAAADRRLSEIAAAAAAAGVRLRLTYAERESILEHRLSLAHAVPRLPAGPLDPASTSLPALPQETVRLATYISSHKAALADRARSIRFAALARTSAMALPATPGGGADKHQQQQQQQQQ